MKQILTFTFILMVCIANAQTSFKKRILNAYAPARDSRTICKTADGGLILAGTSTYDFTNSKIVVTKTDSNTAVTWSKTYDFGINDVITSIIQTKDGGYVATGFAQTYDHTYDSLQAMLVFKLNRSGDVVWSKKLNIVDSNSVPNNGSVVLEAANRSLIILGNIGLRKQVNQSVLLVNLDKNGNLIKAKTILSNNYINANDIALIDGRHFVLSGSCYTNNGFFPMLVKINAIGRVEWSKYYDNLNGPFNSVTKTSDNGIAVTGNSNPLNGREQDISVAKIDSNGNAMWARLLGSGAYDFGYSVIESSDKGIVLAGSYDGNTSTHKYKLGFAKLTKSGQKVWTKSVYDDNFFTEGYSIIETNDNGYIAYGSQYNFGGGYLIKSTQNGDICNTTDTMKVFQVVHTNANDVSLRDSIIRVVLKDQVPVVSAGATMMDLCSNSLQSAVVNNVAKVDDKSISIYPNPASDVITINGLNAQISKTISIVNASGNVLQTINSTQQSSVSVALKSLTSGVYYILINENGKRSTLQFIKK